MAGRDKLSSVWRSLRYHRIRRDARLADREEVVRGLWNGVATRSEHVLAGIKSIALLSEYVGREYWELGSER